MTTKYFKYLYNSSIHDNNFGNFEIVILGSPDHNQHFDHRLCPLKGYFVLKIFQIIRFVTSRVFILVSENSFFGIFSFMTFWEALKILKIAICRKSIFSTLNLPQRIEIRIIFFRTFDFWESLENLNIRFITLQALVVLIEIRLISHFELKLNF